MRLKHKESGKIYRIAEGKVLKAREAKKKNITASFITAVADDGEEVGVVLGYKKDGTVSEVNFYEILEDEG